MICYLCGCEIADYYMMHGNSSAHISCALVKPLPVVPLLECNTVAEVLAIVKKTFDKRRNVS